MLASSYNKAYVNFLLLLNSDICAISAEMSAEVYSKHPRSCVVSLLSLRRIRAIFCPLACASNYRALISLGGSSVVIKIGILQLKQSHNAWNLIACFPLSSTNFLKVLLLVI